MIPTSKTESIAILEKYRHQLTHEQYKNIEYAIVHMAIEGLYLNEEEIERAVRGETGKITEDEEIAEAIKTSFTG